MNDLSDIFKIINPKFLTNSMHHCVSIRFIFYMTNLVIFRLICLFLGAIVYFERMKEEVDKGDI